MSYSSDGGRWWENYLVRYFLPSIAGMVILRWIDANTNSGLSKYIPTFYLNDWKDFGTPHLIIWLLFGSLYCYLASYPVLVFHATRALDFNGAIGKIANPIINPYLVTIIFCISSYFSARLNCIFIAFISVSLFSTYQIYRLYLVYSTQKQYGFDPGFDASLAYAYLNKLSKKRGVIDECIDEEDEKKTKISSRQKQDMADSYRHMREHGNTGFIFILEMALCPIILVSIKNPLGFPTLSALSVLLVIWVLPSALVHWLAQHIERRYSLFRH